MIWNPAYYYLQNNTALPGSSQSELEEQLWIWFPFQNALLLNHVALIINLSFQTFADL